MRQHYLERIHLLYSTGPNQHPTLLPEKPITSSGCHLAWTRIWIAHPRADICNPTHPLWLPFICPPPLLLFTRPTLFVVQRHSHPLSTLQIFTGLFVSSRGTGGLTDNALICLLLFYFPWEQLLKFSNDIESHQHAISCSASERTDAYEQSPRQLSGRPA